MPEYLFTLERVIRDTILVTVEASDEKEAWRKLHRGEFENEGGISDDISASYVNFGVGTETVPVMLSEPELEDVWDTEEEEENA